MRTRIKFCGITRIEDADVAVRLGADAIGLVLVKNSPRFISLDQAAIIRRRLPPFVQAVALFRNAEASFVRAALEEVWPDMLQFHGEEDADFCEGFGAPYIKAVPMQASQNLRAWAERYDSASALLLDAHAPGGLGGSGKSFDWSQARGETGKPIILAGGLQAENVAEAVRTVRPYAVDVSSGIESAPGIKDQRLMQQFVNEVRRADAS